MKWVMTERKVIEVGVENAKTSWGMPTTRAVVKVFEVGDEAPAGHEGKPYTRAVPDPDSGVAPHGERETRIAEQGQDRMDRGRGAKKRRKE